MQKYWLNSIDIQTDHDFLFSFINVDFSENARVDTLMILVFMYMLRLVKEEFWVLPRFLLGIEDISDN